MLSRKLFLSLSLLLSLSPSLFADNTNWMSQIPDSRIMNQLIIPGTHDSGTYGITPTSKFSLSPDDPLPIWIEEISNILPSSLVLNIVAGWSKTQPYTISDQLNNGIRYLDFRVDLFQDGHFYLNHALLSVRLYDALQQIQTFTQQHPGEIILLDINHVFDIKNPPQQTQLVQLLKTYLGAYAVPNTYRSTDTMGDLRKSNRNVIILMDMNQAVLTPSLQQFSASYFWHQSNIDSPWPNKAIITDLKPALDAEIAARAQTENNNFFVLQTILSESTDQIINGIIKPSVYPSSIQLYTDFLNKNIGAWLEQYNAQYKKPVINIVIQDWFTNQSNLVPMAIQYDTQTLSAPLKDQSTNAKLGELKQWYLNKAAK
ncbi:MAG: phosphatidylinositol-specific phospholipase C domain-containing protein [Gammaproteobacteria bacterium]|nr:phosphatidylinositol-specific phospholipase C domain-containing protein [Gammaproteobacteria bacterium]